MKKGMFVMINPDHVHSYMKRGRIPPLLSCAACVRRSWIALAGVSLAAVIAGRMGL